MPPPKGFWEAEKAKEQAQAGSVPKGVLDGVPVALPALSRAVKLQAKAARVGFDWPSSDEVLTKIAEECQELQDAARALPPISTPSRNMATCSSPWPISPAISALDPEAACGVPMPSSSGASAISRRSSKPAADPGAVRPRRDGRPWNDAKAKERA